MGYSGQIYVLVNGLTYSAGASVARYLKEYGNATTLGQETGTRYEGFVAGSTESIYLPNSNIKIGISRYHILFPVSKKQKTNNRGLIPDVESICNMSNIEKGIDNVLDKAIEMISN